MVTPTHWHVNPMAVLAQAESAPPAAQPTRDSRQDFMPVDPLSTRLGGDSISSTAVSNERITVLARNGVEPGLSVDERGRARRLELVTVLLVIAAVAVAAIWFYWSRGHFNFAGQGHNRE